MDRLRRLAFPLHLLAAAVFVLRGSIMWESWLRLVLALWRDQETGWGKVDGLSRILGFAVLVLLALGYLLVVQLVQKKRADTIVTVSASASARRPASATLQPSASSARAAARPTPDPAPVTTAYLVVIFLDS